MGSPPEVCQIGEQQVAQINLAVRARMQDSSEISWITVDCWDHKETMESCWHALPYIMAGCSCHILRGRLWASRQLQARQVAQYVHKGMQIAVGGRLKQAMWTETTGVRQESIRCGKRLLLDLPARSCSMPLQCAGLQVD